MKKYALLALVAILSLVGQTAQAQYQRGDMLFNGGISMGLLGYGFGYGSASGFPALTVNLEYSLDDRFAVGPYLGYFGRTYKGNFGGRPYEDKFSVFAFGGRGVFHATSSLNEWFNWNIDENKFDIYGAVLLGYEVFTWNYDEDVYGSFTPTNSSGRVILGPVIGARYNFNNQIGAFFETGRGTFGVATLGVSVRL